MNDRETAHWLVWQRRPRGRPCTLTARLAERIYLLASKGMTDADIAWMLGISRTTIHGWKCGSQTFRTELEKAKAESDLLVEKALFQRARGLTVTEKRTIRKTGKATEVIVERELPPDAHVCVMWLQNRRPDRWGNRANADAPSSLMNIISGPTPLLVTQKTKQIGAAIAMALGIEVKTEQHLLPD